MDKALHYLARLAYAPRVLAFSMLALMCWAAGPGTGSLALLFLAYPHFTHVWARLPRSRPGTFPPVLYLDSLMVAAACYGLGLATLPVTCLVLCLALSAMLLGGPVLMLGCSLLLTLLLLPGYLLLEPALSLASEPLVKWLALLLLSSFVLVAAYVVRRETSRLINSALKSRDSKGELAMLTDRLSRYIAPQLFLSLADCCDKPATARKRLTVCFSDIQGFTALMDNMEEELLTRILNEYLDAMATIAIKHGGVVDKFLGDGVMVFFGDPTTRGCRQDAVAAVTMALEMRECLQSLHEEWEQRWGVDCPLHIRVGIHSGYCTVGSFGAENRLDYTIIGSSVNLASRLEAIAETDEILVSEDTWQLVNTDFSGHFREPVMLKGIQRPQQAVAITGFCTGERQLNYTDQGIQLKVMPRLADQSQLKALLMRALGDLEREDPVPGPVARILN